ncbi:MAG: MBL fold metallo-hydrolase [Myxococcales bacterium]|nr:MBL fold metallo-hydrolase [Myxococcales bacterium]
MARLPSSGISRRKLLSSAASLGGMGLLSALEWRSLRGDFDHRHLEATSADLFARSLADVRGGDDALIHIGHCTHLFLLSGRRVLSDPWFYDPAHGGMVHAVGPAIEPGGLPPVDLILITHEHPDHADPRALDALDKRATVVVPTKALQARVRKLGFRRVERLHTWQSLEANGVRVTATTAVHDVAEVGYVVERSTQRIYVAGDTALHPDMEAIAERFSPTLAILPVDGTELPGTGRWVMNPQEAAHACSLLRSPAVMPAHADARFTDPVLRLWARTLPQAIRAFGRAVADRGIRTRLFCPAPGERITLSS